MHLIIDDSYFPTNKSINIDNAIVIACVLIQADCRELFINIFEDVMRANGLPDLPIKHCLDDRVRREYKLRKQEAKYHNILRKKHSVIIDELLKKTSSLDYQLLVNWNYIPLDSHKVKIGEQKLQSTSESFINTISEANQHYKVRSILSDRFDYHLQPIIDKRVSLWTAESLEKAPLIHPPDYYTGCSFHIRLLQFADIVTGIMRNLIQSSVKGDPIFAPHCAHIIPKLMGYPNKISEKGLFGPPEYQESILEAMKTTLDFTRHLPKLNQ